MATRATAELRDRSYALRCLRFALTSASTAIREDHARVAGALRIEGAAHSVDAVARQHGDPDVDVRTVHYLADRRRSQYAETVRSK